MRHLLTLIAVIAFAGSATAKSSQACCGTKCCNAQKHCCAKPSR
jgi:hypothetical protein